MDTHYLVISFKYGLCSDVQVEVNVQAVEEW